MIAVIDYDVGNISAVANMFKRLGITCEITADPDKVHKASGIVLPGNGAFDACMRGLHESGLVPVLEKRIFANKVPVLGICVGAQIMGRGSEEGNEKGLGWIDMQVKRFPEIPGLLIPHMGWCSVERTLSSSPLLQSLGADARFYFVHSYFMEAARADHILLKAHHGIDFAAAVQMDNILGVQFHPEKSHRFGKQLLTQFAEVAR